MEQKQSTKPRILKGEVVSNKMKDTVVVRVNRYFKHPKYGKYIVKSKRYKAHDAGNTCVVGDSVSIEETRPISKDKSFKVIERTAKVSADDKEENNI